MTLYKLEYSYMGDENRQAPVKITAYASRIEDLEEIVILLGRKIIYEKYSKVEIVSDRLDYKPFSKGKENEKSK